MPAPSYRGLTEAQLILIRDEALKQEIKGHVMISGAGGGKSFGRQLGNNPAQRLEAALRELRRINPTKYGPIVTQTSFKVSPSSIDV